MYPFHKGNHWASHHFPNSTCRSRIYFVGENYLVHFTMLYTLLAVSSFDSSSEEGNVCLLSLFIYTPGYVNGNSSNFSILPGWCRRKEVSFRNRDSLLLLLQDPITWILFCSFEVLNVISLSYIISLFCLCNFALFLFSFVN